jgi:hypothetical protein
MSTAQKLRFSVTPIQRTHCTRGEVGGLGVRMGLEDSSDSTTQFSKSDMQQEHAGRDIDTHQFDEGHEV